MPAQAALSASSVHALRGAILSARYTGIADCLADISNGRLDIIVQRAHDKNPHASNGEVHGRKSLRGLDRPRIILLRAT